MAADTTIDALMAEGLEDGSTPAKLTLRCDSVKLMHTMASAIASGKRDQYAVMAANSKGLRISIETLAKSMHATSYLNREIFSQYDVSLTRGEGTEIRFKVNVAVLLDCLAVYGPAALPVTMLHLSISEEDNLLHLLLDESGVTTECLLTTVDVDDNTSDYEAAFRAHPVVAKCMLPASVLQDVMKEVVDTPGATSVAFTLSPREPFMRMHTYGGLGSCTMDIPHTSDAFLVFEAKQEATHSYHVRLLTAAMRALANAESTFIRVNSVGMLGMAHKVAAEGGVSIIINFIIMPDEPASEEDEGHAAGAEAAQPRKRGRMAMAPAATAAEGTRDDDEAEYQHFAAEPVSIASHSRTREPVTVSVNADDGGNDDDEAALAFLYALGYQC